MAMKLRSIWELVTETFTEWMSDGVPQLAAGLAFYTIFSLSPILVIVVAVIGAWYGQEAARIQVLEQTRQMVGEQGAQIIETALENAYVRSPAATAAGILGLLVGATVVFVNLQHALNTIWGVAPGPGWRIWALLRKRLLSFLMVLGLGLIVLLSVVIGTVLAAVSDSLPSLIPAPVLLLNLVDSFIWIVVLTLAFAVIYKFLPDVRIAWRDVWIGAAAAAILFVIGKALIAAYLARSATASAYGVSGSLVLFLLWIYYSSQIFLLCGELTQVYARRYGAGIEPDDNSVRVLKSYQKL
jgi:membrane protein